MPSPPSSSAPAVRIKRKHVWVDGSLGRRDGPVSIVVATKHAEVLRPTRSPVTAVMTSTLRGARAGALSLSLPVSWSKKLRAPVKLTVEGPEVALTKEGLKLTGASVTMSTTTREREAVDVTLSVNLDRWARRLLTSALMRRGSRWLQRGMPLLGLGVHLRFLQKDVAEAIAASKNSGADLSTALCWVRVAADVVAIPYPAAGVVTHSAVWLAEHVVRRADDPG